jgi:hypothetical protein
MNRADILAGLGIKLNSYANGEHTSTCPACSATRKKKKIRCLSVMIDADGYCFFCHHCGHKGGTRGTEDAAQRLARRPQDRSRSGRKIRAPYRPDGGSQLACGPLRRARPDGESQIPRDLGKVGPAHGSGRASDPAQPRLSVGRIAGLDAADHRRGGIRSPGMHDGRQAPGGLGAKRRPEAVER